MLPLLSATCWINLVSSSWVDLVKSHFSSQCLGLVTLGDMLNGNESSGGILSGKAKGSPSIRSCLWSPIWWSKSPIFEYGNKWSALVLPVCGSGLPIPSTQTSLYSHGRVPQSSSNWVMKIEISEALCRSFFLCKCLCLKCSTPPCNWVLARWMGA